MVEIVTMSRDESQEGRGKNTSSVPRSTQAENRVGQEEQLLPGIPNEITLDMIAPKLPWGAFHILASVSCRWRRAIQSRQVYDARVRSKSMHTLLGLTYMHDLDVHSIVLYSMEDDSCYNLPEVPGVQKGIPDSSEWIFLDGKVYVLGGLKDEIITSDVHVFDLAGQRQWKQCACMRDARVRFGCGVKDGKIYVFGGIFESNVVYTSEVYDPDEDAWSPITPIPSFPDRVDAKVTIVGDEIFLHDGMFYDFDESRASAGHLDIARSAEVYHPHKDEWRIVEHFIRGPNEELFMMGGKLHRLYQDFVNLEGGRWNRLNYSNSLEVYDVGADSWIYPQQISFGVTGGFLYGAVGVDDEVVAHVNWRVRGEDGEEDTCTGFCLIRIKGVGGRSTEIAWQRLQCSLDLDICWPPALCSIQL